MPVSPIVGTTRISSSDASPRRASSSDLAAATSAMEGLKLGASPRQQASLLRIASTGTASGAGPAPALDLPRSRSAASLPHTSPSEPTAPAIASEKPKEPYMVRLQAAQAAWDIHDDMVSCDVLGALGVKVGTLAADAREVPPFEVTCERLAAASATAAAYGELLRCLNDPTHRDRLVANNDAAMLRQVHELAASGIMRAWADYRLVSNQITMANCNASLQGFMERMLAKGTLQPDEQRVQAYHATRAWPHHDEVVQACAPVAQQVRCVAETQDEQESSITHAAWLPWFNQGIQAFEAGIDDVAGQVQQILFAP